MATELITPSPNNPPLRFSVIIPTCDRLDYLRDAVASASAAAPDDTEILIVNDGTDVDIDDLAVSGVTQPIRIIRNTRTPGPSGARNTGVDEARGATLLFLDDDDVIVEGYWAAVHARVSSDASASCYGISDKHRFKDRSHITALQASHRATSAEWLAAGTVHKPGAAPALSRIAGLGSGFWIARSTYLAVGGLDEDMHLNEDTEFCIRLIKSGATCVRTARPGVLVFAGEHDKAVQTSISRRATAESRLVHYDKIAAKHPDFMKENPDFNAWLTERRMKFASLNGDRTVVRHMWRDSSLTVRAKIRMTIGFGLNRLKARLRG